MNNLSQIIAVTALGFRSLHTRFKASLIVVAGLASVIVAMLFFLAAEDGIRLAYGSAGDPNRAIVLAVGALKERDSSLSRAAVNTIMDAPGIRKASDGSVLADAETFLYVHLPRKNGRNGNTGLHGVGPVGFSLRPELKLVAGRMIQPGRRELLIGVAARKEFADMDVGSHVSLQDGPWTVVGVFSTGSFIEGDMFADSETLMAGLRRDRYNSVLAAVDDFPVFRKALTGNRLLAITAERESDFWQRQFDQLPVTAIVMVYLLGCLMGAGAVAGTLQTMYAAVDRRQNEIAILRALGFNGFTVAASVVLEAMLLALLGAVIGVAIAQGWFGDVPYNGAYGVFRMTVGPRSMLFVTGWALLVAFIGALSPAIKASRVTVVEALRAY